MMDVLKGWKTVLFNALVFLVGVADMMGIVLPENFADDLNGAILAIVGVVGVTLRAFTNTQIGKSA
jgi:uncharacterized membrane protein